MRLRGEKGSLRLKEKEKKKKKTGLCGVVWEWVWYVLGVYGVGECAPPLSARKRHVGVEFLAHFRVLGCLLRKIFVMYLVT
jgi:hypothetical protein